jgi:AcrR family transcriptional regulator
VSEEAARTPRRYSSKRREQQAAETREAVLAAAAELFGERGWAATGMRDVARRAGVAVETVYANFRSKGDLLTAAVDVGVVGDDAPVALADRPEFAALAVGDRTQRVAAAARLIVGIQRRTAGVHHALREAAASDATLAARLRDDEERRRSSVEQGRALVAGRAVSARERDGLWAVLSMEVYRLLTEQAGWTDKQYEAWVADVVLRLVDDTSP